MMVKAHEFDYHGTAIPVTVSIGAAEYEETMTTEKLVQTADARLYEAKAAGRNRVIC
jgi:diguanylate cyclase (GGDEF)-like protein